jgi:hypothetical protein
MRYKILDSGTSVVLTRHPQMLSEELQIEFEGAPSNATAIFEIGERSIYRNLVESSCSVPVDKLNGVVKVTIAVLDGSARPRKWICEELLAEKQSGGTLVAPNDMNLPQRFVELKLENEVIRQTQERLEWRVKVLEDRLEKLLEGYDLT